YYFTYNLDKLILLISEGYQSEGSRNNGVNSVTKNLPIPQRYQRKEHPNGKSYFNLRAGNNQEIATSIWFDSADQMEVVIGLLTQGIGTGGGKISAALGLADSDAIYPEYRPLQFYEERIEGTEFGFDAFTDEEEKDYFTVNFEAKPILISEIYQSAAARDNGIRSVKKNVKNEKRYERKRHPNGNHYFNLLAGNKQEIATSIWFAEEKEMEKAIRWLLSTGGTRRRKKAKRTTQAAERRYLQQGLKYMCSEITYDTFQSGGNQRFYFLFKTKESKVVLINGSVRGFATEEELNEGITKLLKYAPNKKNYHEQTTKTGKVYFYIKDEDGNNVGRSSLFYDTADQMNAAIDLLACGAGIPAAAAAPAASKDKVIDDYLPCEAYAGETGFHKFFNEEKNEHYFSYNRASDGKTMLRSEGYTTEAARDNGIRSVIKNAPLEERWRSEAVLNGKYFCYLLRAGNNQEIARSCYYSDSADMQADFDWIRGGESTIGLGSSEVNGMLMSAAMLQAEEDAKKKPVLDDYLPCEAYAGEKGGFHTFFDEEKKEYYFSFIDDNGDVALRSEGYTTAAARDNGIASVKKNAPIEERWKKDTALNGRYHFYLLKAGNNQEIARSCYYEDEAAMLAAWGWVRGENSTIGIGSGLVNGALMSAAMIRAKDAEEEA
ncbi:MAG: YegP family protein, partial [Bacteroidota bacterium]